MNKRYITERFTQTADQVFALGLNELEEQMTLCFLPSVDSYRAEITARLALINHLVQEHMFFLNEESSHSPFQKLLHHAYDQPYTESWSNKLGFTLVFEVAPSGSWTASIRGEVIESGTDHDSLASYKELTLNPNYTNV
jgi:hypothetical protein